MDGHTLAAVTAHLAAHGHDPAAVSAWFTRWMSQGMIRGCDRGVRDE
ncbi:MAG: hypothetical protein HY027_10405 [Deltaproteobacteria bacterium]|nr:hypothetical protein [Deltaproteobacteria bacterium]